MQDIQRQFVWPDVLQDMLVTLSASVCFALLDFSNLKLLTVLLRGFDPQISPEFEPATYRADTNQTISQNKLFYKELNNDLKYLKGPWRTLV